MINRRKIQIKGGLVTKLAASLFVILAVSATLYLATGNHSHPYLEFSNLPAKSIVTASVIHRKTGLPLVEKQDNTFIFETPVMAQGAYKISTSVKSDSGYRDLDIAMNAAASVVRISGKGFAPFETIDVRNGNDILAKSIHADWSGKIDYSQNLPAKGRKNLCFETSDHYTLCHALPERRAS